MAGDKIPDDHSLARYIPWAKLRKDEEQNVIGVLAIAFELRPDENELSANWLEYYADERANSLAAMISAAKNGQPKPGGKSGFAIGLAGKIAAVALERSATIRILYAPETGNDAHVELRRWPRDNKELFDQLADEVWADLVLTKDFP